MIDVDAAKAWIKKETADEDGLIGGLVSSAIATIEAQTGKNMSAKAFVTSLSRFPRCWPYALRFTIGPVTAIDSIEYDPCDGTAAVEIGDFRLVDGYGKSFNGSLQPAFGAVWPATLAGPGTVRISGTAGYEDGEAPDLDTAALLLVSHWYHNREAVISGPSAAAIELPLGVELLIRPYRPSGLA